MPEPDSPVNTMRESRGQVERDVLEVVLPGSPDDELVRHYRSSVVGWRLFEQVFVMLRRADTTRHAAPSHGTTLTRPPTVPRRVLGWGHATGSAVGRDLEHPLAGRPPDRLIRTVDGLDGRRRGRRAQLLPGLDPRPRGRPPRAQRRGPRPARCAGCSKARRLPMYASQEARDADIADARRQPTRRDPRPAARRRPPSSPTRSARCPTTPGGTDIERTPGGRTFTAGGASRACGCARWRSTTPTSAPATATTTGRRSSRSAVLDRDGAKRDGADAVRRARHRPRPDLGTSATVGADRCPGPAADLGWWLTGRGDGAGLSSDAATLPQDRGVVMTYTGAVHARRRARRARARRT